MKRCGIDLGTGEPNNWLQARPVCALLFVLAPRPGLPEPKRWRKRAYDADRERG